ncbi:hypothetical protein BJY24_003510 [Nocardia transvalensis]|uniref:Uncharacterized protein n=1 Tax=Nocardia transvalensis TaxID=37333 RepID=A0A7W9UIQ4_9NOCA|nr:hypothetical protein [Nocardia transvalensis]
MDAVLDPVEPAFVDEPESEDPELDDPELEDSDEPEEAPLSDLAGSLAVEEPLRLSVR